MRPWSSDEPSFCRGDGVVCRCRRWERTAGPRHVYAAQQRPRQTPGCVVMSRCPARHWWASRRSQRPVVAEKVAHASVKVKIVIALYNPIMFSRNRLHNRRYFTRRIFLVSTILEPPQEIRLNWATTSPSTCWIDSSRKVFPRCTSSIILKKLYIPLGILYNFSILET